MEDELHLSPEERTVLRESVELYLTDLRRETAHTESREMQHTLARRQELLEAILPRL